VGDWVVAQPQRTGFLTSFLPRPRCVAIGCGLAGASRCRRDSGELAIEPIEMPLAESGKTGAVGDGASRGECGEAVSQHGAQRGLGGMGFASQEEAKNPAPTPVSADGLRAGEAACS